VIVLYNRSMNTKPPLTTLPDPTVSYALYDQQGLTTWARTRIEAIRVKPRKRTDFAERVALVALIAELEDADAYWNPKARDKALARIAAFKGKAG
jgi:hypothetical protein